ncbi:MAG TPA: helix-turn-helix transcriptional regulator [Kribbellaceae bacterium]
MALATGAFAPALRAAIDGSGLTLDRIQHRLTQRGVKVSVATLSYWQSGRRRPDRPESLDVLHELECVLGVPPGSLSSQLGPPRPRRRKPRTTPLSIGALFSQERLGAMLAAVDTSSDDRLGWISTHDHCDIGPDRAVLSLHTHQVLCAEQDGPDRRVLVLDWEVPSAEAPTIDHLRNCELGRVVVDRKASLLVAELMFDRTLRRGETVVIEYRINQRRPHRPAKDDNCRRVFRLPVRDYLLEVQFAPGQLPAQCHQVYVPLGGVPARRELSVCSAGNVHAVALGIDAGQFGIEWNWPQT